MERSPDDPCREFETALAAEAGLSLEALRSAFGICLPMTIELWRHVINAEMHMGLTSVDPMNIETAKIVGALIQFRRAKRRVAQPDGPFPPNQIWINGQYGELEPKGFLLLHFMWRKPMAQVSSVIDSMYDINEDQSPATFTTQVSRVNKVLRNLKYGRTMKQKDRLLRWVFPKEKTSCEFSQGFRKSMSL